MIRLLSSGTWRLGALGFIASLFLSGATSILKNGGVSVSAGEQPIAFNHRKHVEDLGLECSTCHQGFERETFSGLPAAEDCAVCHLEPQGESEEEAKLVRLLQEGAPLDWQPLFRQPPHVFYSHRTHVVAAEIGCPICHGFIGLSETPPRQVKRLRMGDCVACHRRSGASTACTACHR